ncbi:hypothetical protein KKA14_13585 [bacterium]|nr:hypothetical protein [bacterium]
MKTWEKKLEYQLGNEADKTAVKYELVHFGRDYMLLISGGEAHIGSTAFSDKNEESGIVQFNRLNHREDLIVKEAINALKDLVPGELMVVGGIHYDGITRKQIDQINTNCRLLLEKISTELSKKARLS